MRRPLFALLAVPMLATVFACSSDDAADPFALRLGADAKDSIDSIYADPGTLPAYDRSQRGVIVKFAKDTDRSVEDLQKLLTTAKYDGPAVTSGATVYRISYRTERGDKNNTGVVASAWLHVPTKPRAEWSKLPAVVVSRGTRGQGKECAATKADPTEADDSLNVMIASAVGAGFPVITPDLAGYANFGAAGNPPSGYAVAADVAKSTLDATRAIRKILPDISPKNLFVGHSQGGHTTLSALALSNDYGVEGEVTGVFVHAPLWLSSRSWGALTNKSALSLLGITVQSSPLTAAIAVWYHYTQAELLDGPGEGVKMFKPEFQAVAKKFVENQCLGDAYPDISSQAVYASDLFDPSFADSVGGMAVYDTACADAKDPAVCAKWKARYTGDRPNITGKAAAVPIVVSYGTADATIGADRISCAKDRLEKTDKLAPTWCVEPGKDHGGIVPASSGKATGWFAHWALGEAAPSGCSKDGAAIATACNGLPPND